MKIEDIRKLSKEQLLDLVNDSRKELLKLAINASLEKKATAPHKFKLLRKQIAQANTILTQKELQIG